MKKNRANKFKFMLMLLLLLVVGLGIGYAILTQQLSINNTINYGSMKWDVGFTSAEDFSEEASSIFGDEIDSEGAVIVPATVSLSADKKSISFNVDFPSITSKKVIYVKATLTNNSSFDVKLTDSGFTSDDPDFGNFFNLYVDTAAIIWFDNFENEPVYVRVGDVIRAGESREILIGVLYYELTEDMLFENGVSVTSEFRMTWEEDDASEVINFTISSNEYQALKGMTWEEWVYSSFNTAGYSIYYSRVVDELSLIVYYGNENVLVDEEIVEGREYLLSHNN